MALKWVKVMEKRLTEEQILFFMIWNTQQSILKMTKIYSSVFVSVFSKHCVK